jgi:tRNA(Ile)-lysidine synthase
MNKIIEYLTQVTQNYPADLYFIAVSGGVDSLLLLQLMNQLQLPIHALHVNYQLRGEDSFADEQLVKAFCQKKQIPLSVKSIDFKNYLLKKGGNLQSEARKMRYDFFESHLEKIPNSKLLLAQHQDDQIETFYLQLLRNSGIAGLSGMKTIKGAYLRPFLNFQKKELYQLAKELELSWREDKSNAKNDYSRNRLRNELLPILKKEIPTLEASILLIQEKFKEQLLETTRLIDKIYAETLTTQRLEINTWLGLEPIEKIELLKNLEIPTHLFDACNQLPFSQKGTKLLWKVNGNQQGIIRENDYLYLENKPSEFKIPKFFIEKVTTLPEKFSKSVIYLDESKVKGEISLRKWQLGDRIYPIGLQGSKLISDVLTSAKIPNHLRENYYLLVDSEKILACLNLTIDRRSIATTETKNILKIIL